MTETPLSAGTVRIEKVEKFPAPEFAELQRIVFADLRLPSEEFAAVVAAEADHFARATPFAPFQRQRFAAYDGEQFVGWSVG